MNITKKHSYLPLAFLVFIYFVHAIEGLTGSEDFYTILGVLGLPSTLVTAGVYFAGVHDALIVLLLLFKNRLAPKLPWEALIIWTGIWPWIPRAFEWYGGLESGYIEATIISVAAVLAYYVHKKRKVRQ